MPDLLIAEALEQSDLIYERAAIDAAIAGMADAIAADYIGQVPANRMGDSFVPVFLTVMHGALPFAGQLALELGARGLDLQFDYLHATRYRGSNQGGLSELREVEPITTGRMIDRLQEAQIVERRPDPHDRRAWRLHLTGKGEEMLDKLRPLASETLAVALVGLA